MMLRKQIEFFLSEEDEKALLGTLGEQKIVKKSDYVWEFLCGDDRVQFLRCRALAPDKVVIGRFAVSTADKEAASLYRKLERYVRKNFLRVTRVWSNKNPDAVDTAKGVWTGPDLAKRSGVRLVQNAAGSVEFGV